MGYISMPPPPPPAVVRPAEKRPPSAALQAVASWIEPATDHPIHPLAQAKQDRLPQLPADAPEDTQERNSPADSPLIESGTESNSDPVEVLTDPDREDASEDTEAPAQENPAQSDLEDLLELEDAAEPEPSQSSEDFISQLQLTSDTQEFDPAAQIITARGNVVLQLNDAIIEAEELWVNLVNRYALAEGDVLLTRGSQIIEGNRLQYNFIQQSGTVGEAIGTIYLPAIEEDLASPLDGLSASRRAYDPIRRNPDSLLVESDGTLEYGTPLSTEPAETRRNVQDEAVGEGAALNQLRFETDELTFDVAGWRADEVRITNDPFSPPELELRTDGLVLRNVSPTQDELLLKRPRLVFDQGLSIPLVRSRILISRGNLNPEDLNPVPIPVGIDGRDRGGFYLGSKVPIINNETTQLDVTPQFFAARAFSGESSSPADAQNFGMTSRLRVRLSDRTRLTGNIDLTSFELGKITEHLRASLRAEQLIGTHRLSLQYGYRERLFNGSLGFQDVQSSLGAVLLSPTYTLGNTGVQLTYQASAQWINAETDQADLLEANNSETGRITAGRYQGSVALQRGFGLWRGEPKPATQAQGLRFTPQPVVPFLNLNTGIRTTLTQYSTGDSQNSLVADIGLEAQLGHFARNFGDYTRLNIGYSQSFIGDASSPFLFDREVDRNVLTLGMNQQLYGPFLVGYQTALSFDGGGPINSIYSLEYSRRTYGLLLRYDTVQNTGSIGFRLSNFRWIGDTNPFDTPRVRPVRAGVIETR
ncbi:MAG: DUF3769 domain-containing protein [Cyanobacteria bacterium J06598_1]